MKNSLNRGLWQKTIQSHGFLLRFFNRREYMSIENITIHTPLLENLVIDASKDAIVIDSVSKVFRKSRPLLRWSGKAHKEHKQKEEVRAIDNVSLSIKRCEI